MLKKVEKYCRAVLQQIDPAQWPYHCLRHTESVVSSAKLLGEKAGIAERDLELLICAAWFHDLGYLRQVEGHEEVSMEMAAEFWNKNGGSKEDLQKVLEMIAATKMPQSPKNFLGELMADADLSGLGKPTYASRSLDLRKEKAMHGGDTANEEKWLEGELKFLNFHRYFTKEAEQIFGATKQQNLLAIKERRNQMDEVNAIVGVEGSTEIKNKKGEKKKRKAVEKSLKRGRGVESLFRVALRNHISLSAIADRKANILLSVNAIIISVSLSVFVPQMQANHSLTIPVAILMLTNVVTIVWTILATRPNVTSGHTTRAQIQARESNLTFFGNFYKMDLEDYLWGMDQMINDEEFIYKSFSRDLYFLGIVLAKKYARLRMAYTVFMVGLIIASLGFIAVILFDKAPMV